MGGGGCPPPPPPPSGAELFKGPQHRATDRGLCLSQHVTREEGATPSAPPPHPAPPPPPPVGPGTPCGSRCAAAPKHSEPPRAPTGPSDRATGRPHEASRARAPPGAHLIVRGGGRGPQDHLHGVGGQAAAAAGGQTAQERRQYRVHLRGALDAKGAGVCDGAETGPATSGRPGTPGLVRNQPPHDVVGCRWRLAAVGGWQLVAVGSWQLVVGGWWFLGAVLKGGPKKKHVIPKGPPAYSLLTLRCGRGHGTGTGTACGGGRPPPPPKRECTTRQDNGHMARPMRRTPPPPHSNERVRGNRRAGGGGDGAQDHGTTTAAAADVRECTAVIAPGRPRYTGGDKFHAKEMLFATLEEKRGGTGQNGRGGAGETGGNGRRGGGGGNHGRALSGTSLEVLCVPPFLAPKSPAGVEIVAYQTF